MFNSCFSYHYFTLSVFYILSWHLIHILCSLTMQNYRLILFYVMLSMCTERLLFCYYFMSCYGFVLYIRLRNITENVIADCMYCTHLYTAKLYVFCDTQIAYRPWLTIYDRDIACIYDLFFLLTLTMDRVFYCYGWILYIVVKWSMVDNMNSIIITGLFSLFICIKT